MKKISVIIPIFNEEKNVSILYQQLLDVFKKINYSYEIIFVDDGSSDGTSDILNKIYSERNGIELKIISLSKQSGQTQAIQAGLDRSVGDVCVLLDGDLQNDPQDIPMLLEKINEGWDLVNGWRKERCDPFLSKRVPSLVANAVIRCLTKVKIHDFGCTLKVFRRSALENYIFIGCMHRLFPLYFALKGYRVTEMVVNHRARQYGKTKYGFLRTYELMLELIRIHFFTKHFAFPLYYFGITASFLMGSGTLLGAYVIIRRILFQGLWLSPLFFISIILFFLGVQIFLIGLLAEILVRVYLQNNKTALYTIKEVKE